VRNPAYVMCCIENCCRCCLPMLSAAPRTSRQPMTEQTASPTSSLFRYDAVEQPRRPQINLVSLSAALNVSSSSSVIYVSLIIIHRLTTCRLQGRI